MTRIGNRRDDGGAQEGSRRRARSLARPAAVVATVLAVAALAAVFAPGSSATLSPGLVVTPGAGSTAGATGSAGFAINFGQSAGDAVKDVSIDLPPGMMVNEELAGGACLSVSAPTPACAIASGTATIAGTPTPMGLYLVRAPSTSALAGVDLVAGSLVDGGTLNLRSSSNIGIEPSFLVGAEMTFPNLPADPLDSLSFTLNDLTLPSSCAPSAAAVWADSQQRKFPWHAIASYDLTGCTSLQYQPGLLETVKRDPGSSGGVFAITLLDPPGSSSTQSAKIQLPDNVSLNPQLASCMQGSGCVVGTVTAASPIMPSSQLTGTLTLGGTQRAPSLRVSFPPPLNLQLLTTFSPTSLSLLALPDIPLTNLTLTFTGTPAARMFDVQCYGTIFSALLSPRSGNGGVNFLGAVSEGGCDPQNASAAKARPTARASLAGLAAGAPRLSLEARKGRGAPGIVSVSLRLPPSLHFGARAVDHGHVRFRALTLRGAILASARIRSGTLVLVFRHASARSSLSLRRPLLVARARRGGGTRSSRAARGALSVVITDARGHRTRLTLKLAG